MGERETALVTGASGGIGLEIARLLAARGHGLALVARREALLEEIAAGLRADHGVPVDVLPEDLSRPGAAERIEDRTARRGLAVSRLVNCAGQGAHGPFVDLDRTRQLDLLALNVSSLVDLTRRFLPGMVRRGAGRVLNVASTAAFQPGPYMAVYFASKSFVLSFSEALSSELRGSGVTVTALCPGPTRSGFWDAAGVPPSRLVERAKMDSARVARAGVRGMEAGRSIVVPGFANRVSALSVRLLPRSWVRAAIARFWRRVSR